MKINTPEDWMDRLKEALEAMADAVKTLKEAICGACRQLLETLFRSGLVELKAAHDLLLFMSTHPGVETIRTRYAEAARRPSGRIDIRTLGPKRFAFSYPSDDLPDHPGPL